MTKQIEQYLQAGVDHYTAGELLLAKAAWEQGVVYCEFSLAIQNNLALVLHELGELDKAEYVLAGILANGANAITYNTLGLVKLKRLDYVKAAEYFSEATVRDPNLASAWSNLGLVFRDLKDFNKSEQYYVEAVKRNPNNLETMYRLSELYLLAGNYTAGFELYEYRFTGTGTKQMRATIATLDSFDIPRWDKNKVNSLLLVAEQGFGDSIMMMRYINRIHQYVPNITVCCPAPLTRLFEKFGVAVVNSLPLQRFDSFCPLMSLPLIFGETVKTVEGAAYIDVLDDFQFSSHTKKPRVGLCWAGNPDNMNDASRSIPFETLKPLLLVEEVDLVSLNRGTCLNLDDDSLSKCSDFYDTARLIKALDLIISVDTAVIHLAGALGKKALLLNRATSEWRWGAYSRKTPWYSSVDILRQRKLYDWTPVVLDVIAAMHRRYDLSQSLPRIVAHFSSVGDSASAEFVKRLQY